MVFIIKETFQIYFICYIKEIIQLFCKKLKVSVYHIQQVQIMLFLQLTVTIYHYKYSSKCLRCSKFPFVAHLWRSPSSYTTEVEKKLSDERGFILAQRMDGWLFKSTPKTGFLYARLWVLGLTVKLPSSKIIKSYILFTNFQVGKHTWQYLVIQPMAKVF